MMYKKSIFKLLLLFLLPLYALQTAAQQSRVDSIIRLLNTSIKDVQVDATSFSSALDLLNQTSLNLNQIEQLESAAEQFKNLEDGHWTYQFKQTIFFRLIKTDPEKAINYGKQQLENLEKYNTPETSEQKRYFLSVLRLPYRNSDKLEEGLLYFSKKLNQYKTENDSVSIATSYYVLSGFYSVSGLNDLAIYNIKKSISYLDPIKFKDNWLNNTSVLGSLYLEKPDNSEGKKILKGVLRNASKAKRDISFIALNLAEMMLQDHKTDSTAYYLNLAKPGTNSATTRPDELAAYLQTEALYYIQIGDLQAAEKNINECWVLIRAENIPVSPAGGTIAPDYYLALIRIKQNRLNEAISLLKSDIDRLNRVRSDILRDYQLMAELYQKIGENDLAAETYALFIAMKDRLLADQDKLRVIGFEAEQQLNENELSIEKLESQNTISSLFRNFSIGIAVLLLVLSTSIYYRFRSKQKANKVLNETLANLKTTQRQLVQAEKMASLGELTAGIAHEIQNPLNFVNNFSEVNIELSDELQEEVENGNSDEIKSIVADIKKNSEKINHHGKRADAIVKGMLEHSRTNKGDKTLTNLNTLADEFVRLAYHGLRAKDKSFNADYKLDLDPKLPKVNMVAPEIGRVILNLLNNAFFAVNEKANSGVEGYKPEIIVQSKVTESGIQLSVKDNGNGIPKQIIAKIFQPFFTTKPTGEGTGLGLSLSYDIITAHKGELNANSTEGQGTEIIISLPIKD